MRWRHLLERAKSTYDLVVIDTPPLTAVSDAFPLLGKVDGVVIVGRVGRNRRDVAERLHETLSRRGRSVAGSDRERLQGPAERSVRVRVRLFLHLGEAAAARH